MTQEKLVISLSGKKKYAKKKLLQDFQRGITHVFWQYLGYHMLLFPIIMSLKRMNKVAFDWMQPCHRNKALLHMSYLFWLIRDRHI